MTGGETGTIYPPLGHWSLRARCFLVGMDPDKFFEDPVPREVRELCGECPVKEECLDYAVENKPRGFWGGTTERERWKIRRRIRPPVTASSSPRACPGCRSTTGLMPAGRGLECSSCGAHWPAL